MISIHLFYIFFFSSTHYKLPTVTYKQTNKQTQLCALAQLLVDPYYRTIDGLLILIEKEFSSFGFRWEKRCATPFAGSGQERSPVFLQFLDCVLQLLVQHPRQFEFSEELLLLLADAHSTRLFVDFLCECARSVCLCVCVSVCFTTTRRLILLDFFLISC
jgi:hypothetical protein